MFGYLQDDLRHRLHNIPFHLSRPLNGLIDVGNRHTEDLTRIVELLPQLFDDPLLVLLDDLVELGVIFSDFADLGFQGVVALDEYLAE